MIFLVTPGYTVDSRIIIFFFLTILEIVIAAFLINDKSGSLFFFTGVGTVIINILLPIKSK